MAETLNSDGKLTVRLVTPDRVLLDATADAVELPSSAGYLEALYGHAPMLAELGAGEVRLHGGSAGEQQFFVAWGFAEVLPERVTILAEEASKPNEIDRTKAERDLQAAQKAWQEAGDDGQAYDDANAAAREAEEKLAAGSDRTSSAS